MSDFKEWKTKLTPHALIRLSDRTSMDPDVFCDILDNDKIISLGTEIDSSRESKLFFSKNDDKFFIAIQDKEDGYVVTILTLEYWHNLSEKHFFQKRVVDKSKLMKSVCLVDENNLLVRHPPIQNNTVVKFALVTNCFNLVNGGSIDIDLFISYPTERLSKIVEVQFNNRLQNRILTERKITAIKWGMGKEPKIHDQIIEKDIDYKTLINSVKNDIYMRKTLSKKYDDFLVVLNRLKQIGEGREV
jgi:hypothetical protein